MLKVALIGAGKMGISHLSILGAHAGSRCCWRLRHFQDGK